MKNASVLPEPGKCQQLRHGVAPCGQRAPYLIDGLATCGRCRLRVIGSGAQKLRSDKKSNPKQGTDP